MKTLILAAALFLAAKSAYAMHAYASDDCVAMSLNDREISYSLGNDEPASPHRLKMSDDTNPVWVSVGADTDQKDAGLVLRKLSEAKNASKKIGDECFQGSAYTSVRKFRVESLTKTVADETNLSKGDVVYFSCYTDHQEPSGSGCGKN